ncbi:MAG TPA: PhzF family phenazine biosynthesis protein [Gammaproteobacteria bacterium]|nr:PhzF family phenazine biosynthesis protein [Gammaproteobacteria bacterium]
MTLPLFIVDAFTSRPFGGNPAAVCLLDAPPCDDAWLQAVAAEMHLSETAFVLARDDGFDLRWFTPTLEVDLCGHATLAAAHVLWQEGRLPADAPARFHTRSGPLAAVRQDDMIELDFPAEPAATVAAPPTLAGALGSGWLYLGKNRFDYLVEVDSAETVRKLQPDFAALGAISARGVMVTARDESGRYDFVSRFFAPAAGIPEDPVTGSAHCCLGPFWRKRLNKDELLAQQCSARGGVVRIRLAGDRVLLGGQAVTVLAGRLRCDHPA